MLTGLVTICVKIVSIFDSVNSGLGSLLDTVSKDTAHSFILSVSKIQFSQLLLIISVSKYQKDTEDTAFHVSVS